MIGRGVTVVTDFPSTGNIFRTRRIGFDEVLQEGVMYTPTNGGIGAQPLDDAVVSTRYIYTFALALIGIALVASAILFFADRVLKALASREVELVPCLLQ